jgi:hypothetical protein
MVGKLQATMNELFQLLGLAHLGGEMECFIGKEEESEADYSYALMRLLVGDRLVGIAFYPGYDIAAMAFDPVLTAEMEVDLIGDRLSLFMARNPEPFARNGTKGYAWWQEGRDISQLLFDVRSDIVAAAQKSPEWLELLPLF